MANFIQSSWCSVQFIGWIVINSVIFLLCYFNYKIQLKHRYLYKMLSEGLCTSRAAAMIINFCLLLIWLPMCKYFLTELVSYRLPHLKRETNMVPDDDQNQNQQQQQHREGRKLNQSGGRPANKQSSLITYHYDGGGGGGGCCNDDRGVIGGYINKGFDQDGSNEVRGHWLRDNLASVQPNQIIFAKTTKDLTKTATIPTANLQSYDNKKDCNLPSDESIHMEDVHNQRDNNKQVVSGCSMASISHHIRAMLIARTNRLAEQMINTFLMAADYSRSIHITVARTILLASVVHIVAHVINVINFSQRYDVYLTDLNMAKYRGQNPLELLLSVPGITGALMLIILILMSLSSTNLIRNSSYDLFHHLHKLFILFVILLYLHPSSRILKEQSNVERHHPDYCYEYYTSDKVQSYPQTESTASQIKISSLNPHNRPSLALASQFNHHNRSHPHKFHTLHDNHNHQHNEHHSFPSSTSSPLINKNNNLLPMVHDDPYQNTGISAFPPNSNSTSTVAQTQDLPSSISQPTVNSRMYNSTNHHSNTDEAVNLATLQSQSQPQPLPLPQSSSISGHHDQQRHEYKSNLTVVAPTLTKATIEQQQVDLDKLCLDRPAFVSQCSISWYVLSIGLSCFLLDSLFRRLRRTKNPIELISTKCDPEGNLVELILSNNHKRFNHWLPGQYVYLNCPSISKSEWHPFTISSMCQTTMNHFTLHIKTSGDWTKKLRDQLQQQQMTKLAAAAQLPSSCCQRIGDNCIIMKENDCCCNNNRANHSHSYEPRNTHDHHQVYGSGDVLSICQQRQQPQAQPNNFYTRKQCPIKCDEQSSVKGSTDEKLTATATATPSILGGLVRPRKLLQKIFHNHHHRRINHHHHNHHYNHCFFTSSSSSLPTLDHLDSNGQSQVKCTKIIMATNDQQLVRPTTTGSCVHHDTTDWLMKNSKTSMNDSAMEQEARFAQEHDDDTCGSSNSSGSSSSNNNNNNIGETNQNNGNTALVVLSADSSQQQSNNNHSCCRRCCPTIDSMHNKQQREFIIHLDGPFHSPFERILYRENVSICIANGVGWTAFSSLLQYIISNQQQLYQQQQWLKHDSLNEGGQWATNYDTLTGGLNYGKNDDDANVSIAKTEKGKYYCYSNKKEATRNNTTINLSNRLHLIVIVTTIGQLRPLYDLVRQYYDTITRLQQRSMTNQTTCVGKLSLRPPSSPSLSKLTTDSNVTKETNQTSMNIDLEPAQPASIIDPIREISAYITRQDFDCHQVKAFMEEMALQRQQQTNASSITTTTTPTIIPKTTDTEKEDKSQEEKEREGDNEMKPTQIFRINDRFSLIFGRPQFDHYFNHLLELYPNTKAGVFCCGSRQIKKDIKLLCKKMNLSSAQDGLATRFSYHEEDF